MENKDKFSNKVADYAKYRPSYPKEYFLYLVNEVGLSKDSIVADVGAGTGIFTRLLAEKVKKVYAVEPNHNMRTACEEYCSSSGNITIVDGSGENTNLPESSVDHITVAQAFHWFDEEKAKAEFQRILKPKGKVILVWNCKVTGTKLMRENYELLRHLCREFNELSSDGDTEELHRDFFKDGCRDYRVFDNDISLTLEGYIGGSLSASYAPSKDDSNYKEFVDGLTRIFYKYSNKGQLLIPNKTHSYIGEII